LILCDGVVIRFAVAISQPGEAGQGRDNDSDPDGEFCPSLHKAPYAVRTKGKSSIAIGEVR